MKTTYANYEVIVVNNASMDDTSNVIASASKRAVVTIREVVERQQGVAFARNRGVHQARGQFELMTGRELPLEVALEAVGLTAPP